MSGARFTPGPWCIEGRWLGHDMGNTMSGPIYELSEIITHSMNNEAAVEDEANLALIAAAPDMYEALQLFLCIDFDRYTEHDEALLSNVIEQASAAFTKAGGTP